MAAVATYFRYVLVGGVPAMITAIHLVAGSWALTSLVPASVVVRHNSSPVVAWNFAVGRGSRRVLCRTVASRSHPL